MMKDDPPRLPAEIAQYGASILTQWGNVKGFLNELQSLAGNDPRMRAAIAGIKAAGIFISEDCRRLQAAVAAAQACGYISPAMPATALELHPANHDPLLPGAKRWEHVPVWDPAKDRQLAAAGDDTFKEGTD